MSRFDETPTTPEPSKPTTKIEIGGNFYCQHCNLDVDTAWYLPEKHILTWRCPDLHVSIIEEFSI